MSSRLHRDGRFTAWPAAEISRELLGFVAGRVPDGGSLTSETDLLEEELLDSLLIMDLIAHVETAYGVKLANADIAPRNFRNIAALATLIAERTS